MADTDKKFNFSEAIRELDQINQWFQNEDIDLDEGLKKLKAGNALIKHCRDRLKTVENEFINIKQESEEESQHDEPEITEAEDFSDNHDRDD